MRKSCVLVEPEHRSGGMDPGILPRGMGMSQVGRAPIERDLYQKLLEVRGGAESRALLGAILELLVAATEAQRGYLELYPSRDDLHPRWTISHGCSVDDEDEIRTVTSRGIVTADSPRCPACGVKGSKRSSAHRSVRSPVACFTSRADAAPGRFLMRISG
jgi:hypothetical protein